MTMTQSIELEELFSFLPHAKKIYENNYNDLEKPKFISRLRHQILTSRPSFFQLDAESLKQWDLAFSYITCGPRTTYSVYSSFINERD